MWDQNPLPPTPHPNTSRPSTNNCKESLLTKHLGNSWFFGFKISDKHLVCCGPPFSKTCICNLSTAQRTFSPVPIITKSLPKNKILVTLGFFSKISDKYLVCCWPPISNTSICQPLSLNTKLSILTSTNNYKVSALKAPFHKYMYLQTKN